MACSSCSHTTGKELGMTAIAPKDANYFPTMQAQYIYISVFGPHHLQLFTDNHLHRH
jgi:hypothetical protein